MDMGLFGWACYSGTLCAGSTRPWLDSLHVESKGWTEGVSSGRPGLYVYIAQLVELCL